MCTKMNAVHSFSSKAQFTFCFSVDMLSDEPNPSTRPLKRDSEQKILSVTLRLNNNFLSDLTGLMETLSALYAEPTRLAWLDLSFNQFQHIHPVRALPPASDSWAQQFV